MAEEIPQSGQPAPDVNAAITSLVENAYAPAKLSRLERVISNGVATALVTFLGVLMKTADSALDYLGIALEKLEEKGSIVFSPFMARLVGHTLGADVSTSAIRERTNRAGDSTIGKLVAETVVEILNGPGGELQPGDAAAKRLVGALGHMTINNWAEGLILEWVAEYAGWDIDLKQLPELAEQLIRNLGLNRLVSQSLRPYAQILVRNPLLWKLNIEHRPTLLSAGEAIDHYFRGFWTYQQMYDVLARHGYNDASIEALMYGRRKYFSVADVYMLTRVGKWDREQALEHLRESGLEADQAELELQLADAKDLRAHQERVLGDAVAAYVDGQIDLRALDNEIDHGGLDDISKQRHRADALRRRDLHAKHLTLGQAEQAVELEVWGITDYRAYLDRVGYAHDDAITLELMLLSKLKKLDDVQKQRAQAAAERAAAKAARAQDLQARRDALALEHADFSGSLAQAERLVVRGEMTPERYRQVLIDHGLTADDASALAQLAGAGAAEYADAQEKRRQLALKAGRQELALATLEDAVKRGRLSMDAFRVQLTDRKFTPEQIQLLVDVLTDEIAHQAAAERSRAAAAARLATKNLSLAQEETAVRKGVKTISDYRVFLAGAGFTTADAATLVALLESRLVEDLRAEQLHDRIAGELDRSHLSLAQEETAVKDGVKSMGEYALFLTSHGYTADDVETLSTLLALKLGLA